jgi:hypothetical protein
MSAMTRDDGDSYCTIRVRGSMCVMFPEIAFTISV